jgi:hypothetical protein
MLCSLFVLLPMYRIMAQYHRWYPVVFVAYNFILAPLQYARHRQTSSAMQFLWAVFLLRATRRFPGVLTPTACTQTVLVLTFCGVNSLRHNLSLE